MLVVGGGGCRSWGWDVLGVRDPTFNDLKLLKMYLTGCKGVCVCMDMRRQHIHIYPEASRPLSEIRYPPLQGYLAAGEDIFFFFFNLYVLPVTSCSA